MHFIGPDPRYNKIKNICRNIIALTFLVSPKFDNPFPKSDKPESMLEFLFRRIKSDYRKNNNRMRGRVLFYGARVVIFLIALYVVSFYLLDLKHKIVFPLVSTIASTFAFTVILTGSVSYVLSYFGYLAVWETTRKTDIAEMNECAISLWENTKISKVKGGFIVYTFSKCKLATSWTFIDGSNSILQIDFRIFDTKGKVNNMNDEIFEMKRLLEDDEENWWDSRIVIKCFRDGSYGKMINYSNKKVIGRGPLRFCEIDGNHRDKMKIVMEAAQMLSSKSMKNREYNWNNIRRGYNLRNYDAEPYD